MSYLYIPEATSRKFYVPKTLASDFTEFLNNDIPNTVMNFILLKDWYDQFDENYKEVKIRGELYPNSTYSRYSNTDNNLNLRTDVHSEIRKGDMVIDENNNIYILDWEVSLQSNNAPSRALRCNVNITIERWIPEQTNELGYLEDDSEYITSEARYETIVDNLPANAYRYDGRPEYVAISATPGATPNALTLMTVQYNSQTKNIHINDEFLWGTERYHIVDINRVGMNISNQHGVLFLQAKKVPGEINE